MKNIKTYVNYTIEPLNESVKGSLNKFINVFKDIFSIDSIDKKEKLQQELIILMNEYKNNILSNIDDINKKSINQMFIKIKTELKKDVISDFNLDSFFRGLYSIISIKRNVKKNIEEYLTTF